MMNKREGKREGRSICSVKPERPELRVHVGHWSLPLSEACGIGNKSDLGFLREYSLLERGRSAWGDIYFNMGGMSFLVFLFKTRPYMGLPRVVLYRKWDFEMNEPKTTIGLLFLAIVYN